MLVASAGSEVMLGFVLVLAQASAVTRNIMLVFLYWNLLRIRYHVPVSSSYHHAVRTYCGECSVIR